MFFYRVHPRYINTWLKIKCGFIFSSDDTGQMTGGGTPSGMTSSAASAVTPTQEKTAGVPLTDFVQQLEDYAPTVTQRSIKLIAKAS